MASKTDRPRAWLTIVGGQPRRERPEVGTVRVPVGLEKLLYHAARDPAFRERLLEDPFAAAAEARVSLRDSERAMLEVAPRASLAAMVDGVVPTNPRRRRFMGLVASAAASLAAGTAACLETGCHNAGITADLDGNTVEDSGMHVNAGGVDMDCCFDWDADADADADDDALDGDLDGDATGDGDLDAEADLDGAADGDAASDAGAGDGGLDADSDEGADAAG